VGGGGICAAAAAESSVRVVAATKWVQKMYMLNKNFDFFLRSTNFILLNSTNGISVSDYDLS
jgi:hypothetical protein